MKTKDLIEELKNCDPSGEVDVVIDGQPVVFVDHVEGYYDGSYGVYNPESKDERYLITNRATKVRIHTMSVDDLILANSSSYKQDHRSWREYVKMDFGSFLYKEQQEEREQQIAKELDELEKEHIEIHRKVYARAKERLIEKFNQGHVMKEKDGEVMWVEPERKKLNIGEKELISFDKDFYKDDNDYWKYKGDRY